jgi:thymidylate synthase
MNHLKDNTIDQLDLILEKLSKKNIPYSISKRDGKIVDLVTEDQELIKYAKKSNPNLK